MGESFSIDVDAAPEAVWDLIADVPRKGEWSPVTQRHEWTGDRSEPVVGATFRGWSKQGPARWSRECRIELADRGRAFTFVTLGGKGQIETRWTYTLEPRGGGTHVTQAWENLSAPLYVRVANLVMGSKVAEDRRRNIRGSLDALKRVAEQRTTGA